LDSGGGFLIMDKYTLVESEYGTSFIRREGSDGITSIIPVEPGNSDYQDYLAQLDESETE
jgi:hypothetical protein